MLTKTVPADGLSEKPFDSFTRLAKRLLDVPMALIALADGANPRLMSAEGLSEPASGDWELLLSPSVWLHVIGGEVPLVISDAGASPLFTHSDAVGIGAVLAVPIVAPTGDSVGMLCVVDHVPRTWSQGQVDALADLSRAVAAEVAARHYRRQGELAEAALRDREARTAEILERIEEAFYALDREWRFTYVNRSAEKLWHRRREDLLGRTLFQAFPSFVGSVSHRAHERAVSEGQPVKLQTQSAILAVPIEINIFPGPSGLSVFFRDISDWKRMEKELRERDDILTLAESSAGIGVWDIDMATGMVRGTAQFFRIMGLEPTDRSVPIDALRALRHPDDRERVVQGFRKAVTGGSDSYEMEYRILRSDGQVRWIFGRGRVIRDAAGTPVRYSGIDIDITERKRAEAALAESEERLRLAQEAADIGTWDWDIVTGILRWSDNQWQLHGVDKRPGDLTYDDWKAAIHPHDADRASAAVAEAVASKKGYEVEYRVKSGGGVRWVAQRGTVISDGGGRPVRMLGVSVDVTERRAAAEALAQLNKELEKRVRKRTAQLEAEAARRAEAEARLHQAQKMEAVGELTGGIAHDFNNLLTVILGNLDMAKRRLVKEGGGGRLGGRLLQPIELAMQGARNAAQLTHRLLAFSRRQPLEPNVLDINRLVSGLSELIRRTVSETIHLETVLAAGLWPTFADANQLESALLNLVVNARDAMPEGGALTIETANVHFDEAYAATTEGALPGHYVMLSVSDTGCGMAKDVLGRAFEPFFTTKEPGKGSGLGLSMVYGFVKQSGGHVRIYSEVGHGTTVKVYLPRLIEAAKPTAPAAAVSEASAEPLPQALPGETVLLVEDNEEVRRYAVAALKQLGYTVLEAADGPATLKLLDRRRNRRIDLLFTDVVLPGGMSGRTLADRVVERCPGLPVLFTTGYTRNAIVHRDRLDPHVQLLSKPYTLEALARKVRQVIDAGPPLAARESDKL